jgi:guanylate kinase
VLILDVKLKIYIITGCSGSGKTTIAKEFVEVTSKTALISGDDVRDFYCDKSIDWNEKYKLTWQNILLLTDNFLKNEINVMIEYLWVFDNELKSMLSVANRYNAKMTYVVMTASEATIKQRLISRGDAHLIEKALSIQKKLSENSDNKDYLHDGTDSLIETQIEDIKNRKPYAI